MTERDHLAHAARPQHPEPHPPERREWSCWICLTPVEHAGDVCAECVARRNAQGAS